LCFDREWHVSRAQDLRPHSLRRTLQCAIPRSSRSPCVGPWPRSRESNPLFGVLVDRHLVMTVADSLSRQGRHSGSRSASQHRVDSYFAAARAASTSPSEQPHHAARARFAIRRAAIRVSALGVWVSVGCNDDRLPPAFACTLPKCLWRPQCRCCYHHAAVPMHPRCPHRTGRIYGGQHKFQRLGARQQDIATAAQELLADVRDDVVSIVHRHDRNPVLPASVCGKLSRANRP
jgi:hypothetical protein